MQGLACQMIYLSEQNIRSAESCHIHIFDNVCKIYRCVFAGIHPKHQHLMHVIVAQSTHTIVHTSTHTNSHRICQYCVPCIHSHVDTVHATQVAMHTAHEQAPNIDENTYIRK